VRASKSHTLLGPHGLLQGASTACCYSGKSEFASVLADMWERGQYACHCIGRHAVRALGRTPYLNQLCVICLHQHQLQHVSEHFHLHYNYGSCLHRILGLPGGVRKSFKTFHTIRRVQTILLSPRFSFIMSSHSVVRPYNRFRFFFPRNSVAHY
jgi:hypothetical protein